MRDVARGDDDGIKVLKGVGATCGTVMEDAFFVLRAVECGRDLITEAMVLVDGPGGFGGVISLDEGLHPALIEGIANLTVFKKAL